MPDLHAGRGIAVGVAFWSRSHIYPHLVGSDIGCGMGLWRTGASSARTPPSANYKGRKHLGPTQPSVWRKSAFLRWQMPGGGTIVRAGLTRLLGG
ncbi:RtcB family protein [Sphingomonas sp.]|uniref:RtcB family protein n=1 Tax=Sphingomonas sp. TaxID=28214 RepID=UPI0034154BE2